ncbi:MAG: hypothetical protein ISS00_00670 [Candidatus Marinimicrobia bacterium]|nr:hypothetical protein [Candidatus Neomarinimicrobiota bacterium]
MKIELRTLNSELQRNLKTFLLIVIGLLFLQCTEKNKITVHPDDWTIANSEDFHGFALHKGWDGIESCKSCHGSQFNGGTSGISCYQCHEGGANGHPKNIDFLSPTYEDFHGNFISEDGLEELEHCKICHGNELDGGFANVSCYLCHAGGVSGHPEISNHLVYGNADFHGLAYPDEIDHCKTCHGENLDGGNAGVSCYLCHAGGVSGHPEISNHLVYGNADFHGLAYPDEIDHCKTCHGENLDGGNAGVCCYKCHAGGVSGHPDSLSYMTFGNIEFHGNEIEDIARCERCHGENLDGGIVELDCTTCH